MATTVAPPPVETHSHEPTVQSATTPPKTSIFGRLLQPLKNLLGSIWHDPQQRLLVILISSSSISLLVLMWYVAQERITPRPGPVLPAITLDDALSALAQGSHRKSLDVLAQLEKYDMLTAEQQGGPALIRGVILAQDAERMWDQDRARMARQALRYLLTAHQKTVPTEYQPLLLYWLCQMQVEAGQASQARKFIDEALANQPTELSELQRLGTLAWIAEPHPDLARALEFNSAYLAHQDLEVTPRQEALLVRARIYFRLDKLSESREILQNLRTDTNTIIEGLLLEAELTIHAAKSETGAKQSELYRTAIKILQKALERGAGREHIQRQALYWSAICYRALNETQTAYEIFQRTFQLTPQSPEGIAAAVYAAQLAEKLSYEDEKLKLLLAMLKTLGDADHYQNPFLSWSDLAHEITTHYNTFIAEQSFGSAIELALSAQQLLTTQMAHDLAAQARITWAQKLGLDPQQPNSPEAEQRRQQILKLYREAGQDYLVVAENRFTEPDYLEQIWKSAEYSLLGEDFEAARTQLEIYLKNEVKLRRPLALLRLGEAQLMLRKTKEALTNLQECIEVYSRDAASFRARVLAAQALIDDQQPERAKQLYLVNLESGQLTPASSEWRDSLFGLGRLYFSQAQEVELKNPANENATIYSETELQAQQLYQDSIRRLEEAVERYPTSSSVIQTRYFIAESYRRLAAYPRRRLLSSTIRSARDEYNKELKRLLNAAILQDMQIQQSLGNRRENQIMSPLEYTLLRNSFFAQGAALYELGRYKEAVSVYLTMINRYQTEPQVLDAYTQLIKCYRMLNQREEARAAIEQARSTLTRLQTSSTDFQPASNHNAAEWQVIMDWLAQQ